VGAGKALSASSSYPFIAASFDRGRPLTYSPRPISCPVMATRATRFAAVLILSCSLSVAAMAADVRIGDVSLHIPQPTGYCEMDPVLASDGAFIGRLHSTMTKTGNRLLVVSADCSELRDWRNGKRPDLDHMAQYQTIIELENQPLPDTPEKMAKNFCANMDATALRSTDYILPDPQERADRASRDLKLNEIKLLGTVSEDPGVCYTATMQKFKVDGREETTQVTIIATTLLKSKVVQLYLFAPYAAGKTITQLLMKQRANVSQLQRANRSPR
jgi:hypothetical protein